MLNEQQGQEKIENNNTNYSPRLNTNRTNTNDSIDKSTTKIMSELLTQSAKK